MKAKTKIKLKKFAVKTQGTEHDLRCIFCGKVYTYMIHGSGGKIVKYCNQCLRESHFHVCYDCYNKGFKIFEPNETKNKKVGG